MCPDLGTPPLVGEGQGERSAGPSCRRGIRPERAETMAQSAELHKAGGVRTGGVYLRTPVAAELPVDVNLDRWLAGLERDQDAAELWARMQGLKASRRRELLQAMGGRRDPRARKLLAAGLWDEEAEIALAAISGLRELGDSHAVDSLTWLAEISRVRRRSE